MAERAETGLLRSLLILGSVIEARDAYTGGHSWRVGQYSRLLAERIGLGTAEVFLAGIGGFLHDLGKVGVPDDILKKPGGLTDAEYAIIKTHPAVGHDLLRDHPLAGWALDAVTYHHERADGRGYPHGLADEETPLAARIVAVADAFDAMTSTRPYRQGMSAERAVAVLVEESGRQFDAALVAEFAELQSLGRLDHVLGHSAAGRRLVACPKCGPILTVPRLTGDGATIHCRACRGAFRLHGQGDGFATEFVGILQAPDPVRPQPDLDAIEEFVLTHTHDQLPLAGGHST